MSEQERRSSNEEIARDIAEYANQCCNRSDGYKEDLMKYSKCLIDEITGFKDSMITHLQSQLDELRAENERLHHLLVVSTPLSEETAGKHYVIAIEKLRAKLAEQSALIDELGSCIEGLLRITSCLGDCEMKTTGIQHGVRCVRGPAFDASTKLSTFRKGKESDSSQQNSKYISDCEIHNVFDNSCEICQSRRIPNLKYLDGK